MHFGDGLADYPIHAIGIPLRKTYVCSGFAEREAVAPSV
jgi:hypothetical protein